jgi:hypothetical protein
MAVCDRRSFAADTISMARVIFFVFLIERIRPRSSLMPFAILARP